MFLGPSSLNKFSWLQELRPQGELKINKLDYRDRLTFCSSFFYTIEFPSPALQLKLGYVEEK